MTELEEMQAALRALKEKLPANAGSLFISVRFDSCGVIADVGGGSYLKSTGATWREMIASAEADWESRRAGHEAQTIQNIAVAIIRLTYGFGECTDAALRAEFPAEDVTRYGAEAVRTADEMGDGAPFRITTIPGANEAA